MTGNIPPNLMVSLEKKFVNNLFKRLAEER